jgi:hypothetical protein
MTEIELWSEQHAAATRLELLARRDCTIRVSGAGLELSIDLKGREWTTAR